MFFVGRKTTAELELITPLDFCCNCGAEGEMDLVETPLQKTRYFLFFGTELELLETFPYCKRCRRSAKRVRLGWMSKVLMACLAAAAIFLVLVLTAASLPGAIQKNLFASSLVFGVAVTVLYFYLREWRRSQRTYYQPVSLVDASLSDGMLQQLHLWFANAAYARLFSGANSELIATRALKVATLK